MSTRSKSLLAGGLVSSAGILISKVLGLVYVIPFKEILGSSANMSYYSSTYNIYAYILNVAVAGLPFAISTLIAKYAARNDYKTCLLVKKLSFYTMATLGFICMAFMIIFSGFIASANCPTDGDVTTMKNVIIIISFAVFIIPILSSVRGFFNGLREMEIYSASQVVEQLVRILFLLGVGSIAVYIFHTERIWAVYFGVMAATVAGAVTIFYVKRKGQKRENEVIELAKEQTFPAQEKKAVFRELIVLAIPFLINAIFGYCDTIINQFDLLPGLAMHNEEYTTVISSAIFYKATKIIAIPMILSPGFSAAIIPYITSAIENNDKPLVKKYILDCIDTVIYIALPICLAILIFARPIIVVLFGGTSSLSVDTYVLKWYALEALCATVAPIFASIVMALGDRKKVVINTAVFALIKLATNRLLIGLLGLPGMVISSFIGYIVFAALNIKIIQKKANINWTYSLRKIVLMLVGCVGFSIVAFIFNLMGLVNYDESRIICLFILMLMGIICCGVYFVITAIFQVPQTIFHMSLTDFKNKLLRKHAHD